MPKSTEQIIAHGAKLAKRIDKQGPTNLEQSFSKALSKVHKAVLDRAEAEKELAKAIRNARKNGASWSDLGSALGTSGEAARQRFGRSAA